MEKSVVSVCQRYANDRTRLLDILLDIQHELKGITPAAMEVVAQRTGITRVEVEGVVSFYAFLSSEIKGERMIRVCDDIIDRQKGGREIAQIFAQELGVAVGGNSADGRFSLEYTPFLGMSDQAPSVMINDTIFTALTREKARRICSRLREGAEPADLVERYGDGNNAHLLIRSEVTNNIRHAGEVLLNTLDANAGLIRSLGSQPQAILDELDKAGLAGRGGAGFPTGRKWRVAADTRADRSYIICNADEGEPGTFKDRVLLTERADLMIAGMTVAAYSVNSTAGIIYLRAEYAYLRPWLKSVLQHRREQGLLGRAILGREGFDFDIRIQMGAGAYICGEESALISSCEGLRGEPKNRPPFPVEAGYLGYPTIVDNVETFCCAARIMELGSAWFGSIGTGRSTGTKLFSVSGDCTYPGVYELPFGTSVQQLLKQVDAPDAAALLVGGPSGQMINMSQFERRLCLEDLPTGGSVMVFSKRRNLLEIVDQYLQFFIDESCGYCTPCRVGNVFLKKRIEKVRKGLCELEDMDYLKELGRTIAMTSRCGLGHTSPNLVLSTMQNFPLVYAVLLKEHGDGLQASFDIQSALEESRRLAKRRSMIYDPNYDEA
ncbi:MAG: NAD(P)H-dependent oxidoreductase subunit E [Gammaproteobacteria bacterium]|nr:NAD(P)H-dependent oxidoreductase subunit E [Gammaproteobacteria bacterium]MCP5416998.1 NAD(P)H-dependent oxidoreductase subunit E [Chromatiaceae bacterium]